VVSASGKRRALRRAVPVTESDVACWDAALAGGGAGVFLRRAQRALT
jgi:hypothetical protein